MTILSSTSPALVLTFMGDNALYQASANPFVRSLVEFDEGQLRALQDAHRPEILGSE